MKPVIKKETYLEVYEKALNETLADPEGRLVTDPDDAVYNVADRQEVENWISSDPDFQQRLSIMQQQWIKWLRTPAPEPLRQTALNSSLMLPKHFDTKNITMRLIEMKCCTKRELMFPMV